MTLKIVSKLTYSQRRWLAVFQLPLPVEKVPSKNILGRAVIASASATDRRSFCTMVCILEKIAHLE
jgi:hypothetical protein